MTSKILNPGLRYAPPTYGDYREALFERGLSAKEIDAAVARNKAFRPLCRMNADGFTFTADVDFSAITKTQAGKLFKAVLS